MNKCLKTVILSYIFYIRLFNIFAAPKDVLITSKRYTYENRFANMVYITILFGTMPARKYFGPCTVGCFRIFITFHHEFLVEYNSLN